MTNNETIHDRISRLVDRFGGGKNTVFARLVDEKEANIRGYRTSIVPKYYFLEKVVKNLDVDAVWLLTGQGHMLKSDTDDSQEDATPSMFMGDVQRGYETGGTFRETARARETRVPLYPFEAAAGRGSIFGDRKPTPVGYLTLPDLPPVDGAVQVRGESMYPLLTSGDIILYQEIMDFENGIFWGEMYLISAVMDGRTYSAVRYVRQSDSTGYIRLTGFNPQYEPKDIPLRTVRALAWVKVFVHYNTMG